MSTEMGGPPIPGWPFGNHKSARNHTPATFVCGLQGGHAPTILQNMRPPSQATLNIIAGNLDIVGIRAK